MGDFLKQRLEGSPISFEIEEDEYFHPKPLVQYTIRFTFSALKSDNNWESGSSYFSVTDEGLEDEKADLIFIDFYKKVLNQYREFVGERMGFMEYAKEIHSRLKSCHEQLKAERDINISVKKTVEHETRGSRYKRA